MSCLLVSVCFHDGRYHGSGEWPPSPARLFQALIAGAALGGSVSDSATKSLKWLESLAPPAIASPSACAGQAIKNFVPNNDLDAVGGDPARVGEIRAAKIIRPRYFDAAIPLLYAWTFEQGADAQRHAQTICQIAGTLYQLGRGVDMAWARGEVIEDDAAARLRDYGRVIWHPNERGNGTALACPCPGSLTSLTKRFAAARKRFKPVGQGKKTGMLFSQAPKPHFRQVPYDSPSTFLLFDIRKADADAFAPQSQERIVALTENIRKLATERLKNSGWQRENPKRGDCIEKVFVGRESTEADKAQRIRITPLPSIGHPQAERSARRVLVAVPPDCPIATVDIAWAFSGLTVKHDEKTGEVLQELVPADDRAMLDHYGVESKRQWRLWRTVTPAALPQGAARRRIDPSRLRQSAEQKDGAERQREEGKAATSVIQALRHAGIGTSAQSIRVQREPFDGKGERAEAFAPGTRFAKERLWHVEIAFAKPLVGPLIIGDGRYLGLGLMRPVKDAWRDVMAFSLATNERVAVADRTYLLQAVRRALMALSRDDRNKVPPLFSGHEADGAPASSGRHRHVFLAGADLDDDGFIECLIVAAPWACDRSVRSTKGEAAEFDRIVSSLETVRAGRLGVISLHVTDAARGLTGPARTWESHTDYLPTRHAGRGKDPAAALVRDVAAECERRGLPKPDIDLLDLSVGPKDGVAARLRLRFAIAVAGPLLLGRDSHAGGGLFEATRR